MLVPDYWTKIKLIISLMANTIQKISVDILFESIKFA